MKTQQFERLFKNFMQKESSKLVSFDSLNREEKIEYLLSQLPEVNVSKVNITTEKEMEISKLSKDVRFELIQKATKEQNFELIKNLATGKGVATVSVSLPFEKCSISSQLNYLEKAYQTEFEKLPDEVEQQILGGENFEKFIQFCSEELSKLNK